MQPMKVLSRRPRIRSRPEISTEQPHAAFCSHKNTNGHPIQTGLGNFTQKISEEQTASDRFTRTDIYPPNRRFSEFVIPMGSRVRTRAISGPAVNPKHSLVAQRYRA
jgi:hypothetical protein